MARTAKVRLARSEKGSSGLCTATDGTVLKAAVRQTRCLFRSCRFCCCVCCFPIFQAVTRRFEKCSFRYRSHSLPCPLRRCHRFRTWGAYCRCCQKLACTVRTRSVCWRGRSKDDQGERAVICMIFQKTCWRRVMIGLNHVRFFHHGAYLPEFEFCCYC